MSEVSQKKRQDDAEPGRQFVNALSRGLSVLRAFRPDDSPLSNQELARRTGLPKPTVSRLTNTLTELGYLNSEPSTGHYMLGGATLALGQVAVATLDIVTIARPFLRSIAEAGGTTVGLSTREQHDMVVLDSQLGSALIAVRMPVGYRAPILRTAVGRGYLCLLTESQRAAIYAELKRSAGTQWTKMLRHIEQGVEEIEEYGFCIVANEFEIGLNTAAAPIFAPHLPGHYVLGIAGPAHLISVERLRNELGPKLVSAANAISSAVGADDRISAIHNIPRPGWKRKQRR